jgi:hypothetical protein
VNISIEHHTSATAKNWFFSKPETFHIQKKENLKEKNMKTIRYHPLTCRLVRVLPLVIYTRD